MRCICKIIAYFYDNRCISATESFICLCHIVKSIKQQYGVINMTTKKNKQRKKQKHMEHIKHYEPLPEKFPDSAPEMALSGEEKSESSSLRYR